jgi:hypothetical protein
MMEKRFIFVLNSLKKNRMAKHTIRTILSWKPPVALSYRLSKSLLGSKGKTQIIILAKIK